MPDLPVLSAVYWILIGIIIISLAFWPARVAARKGQSFLVFFIFSLFFFVPALIVAYVIKDKSATTPAAPAPSTTTEQ